MSIQKETDSVLNFFKEAFCAERAEIATSEEADRMKIGCVVKITTGDGRGIFYIAQLLDNN